MHGSIAAVFLARHWRLSASLGIALCIALIMTAGAAEGTVSLSCTGADGRTVRPFVINNEDGTRSATFPVTVPGWPALFAVTLPDEDGTSSFDVENGTATVQREGPSLNVIFRNALGNGDEYRCQILPAPPDAPPLCALDEAKAIESCADLYAAAHPACAGEKDTLVPSDRFSALSVTRNAAVVDMQSLLPPWYVSSSPSFLQALLASDPLLQHTLENIESTCGEKLRLALVSELPFGLSGLFSPGEFTVYLRERPLHDESVYPILLHEIRHAQRFCENGKKSPPPQSLCSSEREAMVPLCEFFVTALRDVPDTPAISEFLCSL